MGWEVETISSQHNSCKLESVWGLSVSWERPPLKKTQPKLKNKAKHAFYYILGFLKVWVTISGHRKLVVLQSCTMHTILTRSGIHMLKGIMKIGLVLVNRFLCDQGSSRSASTWLSPLSFVGPQPTQNSLSNSPRTQQRKLKDKKP